MQAEDRLIHFSTELIHPPRQHEVPVLQKLYFELSQVRGVGYDSTDFTAAAQSKFYSRRGKNTQSLALFLPDRLVLVEEWADIPLSDFLTKVREVGARVFEGLGIKTFVAQTATLRSTFSLTHFDDARVFLIDHVCQQADRVVPHFQRPIAVGGLRFVLPETPDHPGTFHVTIESFRQNPKEVFVEVKGIFGHQRIGRDDLDTAVQNIQAVRRFISDRVFPYVDQYDNPEQGIP